MSEHPTGTGAFPASSSPPPLPVQPLPLAYASGALVAYESPRGVAKQVVGWMWVATVAQLLELWPALLELATQLAAARGEEFSYAYQYELAAGGASLIASILVLVAWVMWWIWVYRTYRNLRALGADGLHYSPGWSVAYYFIPIVHLFRPFQSMHETWRASDPRHEGGMSWRRLPNPTLVNWWWGMFLFSTAVAIVAVGLQIADESHKSLVVAAALMLLLVFVEIALMLMQIRIARRVTAMQEERAGQFGTVVPVAAQYAY